MPITAVTMARLPAWVSMSRTKDMSILSLNTGKLCSRPSDEYPVPKSSMDRQKPACTSREAAWRAFSGSFISADSVISSSIMLGSTPCARTRWRARSAKPSSIICAADTLTATRGTTAAPASCQ